MEERKEEYAVGGVSAQKRKRWPIVLGVVAVVLAAAGAGFYAWHQQPSFCANPVCHDTMNTYVASYESGDYLARSHAEANVKCLDCHVPTLEEQIGEVQTQFSGNYRLPLKKRDFGDDFCLRSGCHDRSYLESIVVTTDDGTKVNPHTQTVDASVAQKHDPHHSENGTVLECASCHSMHRESPGLQYCYDSCHHTKTFEVCSDCHEDAR